MSFEDLAKHMSARDGSALSDARDPQQMMVEARRAKRKQQRTSDLIFDIPSVISFVSRYVTLNAGDVIYTGTPGNTRAMKPGDIVEVEIEGIGVLRNPVTRR